MLVADLAQTLEITVRRNHHAGGTGDRLDDDRGDRAGVAQRGHPFKSSASSMPFGGKPFENALRPISSVWRMWSTPGSSGAEELAVVREAADQMPPKPTP